MGLETPEMASRLVPLQHTGKASYSPLGATNRDGNPTNREHHGQLSLQPPPPNQIISPLSSNRATYCSSGAVIPPRSPFSTQSVGVSTIPAHLLFLRKKTPASHRARGGTPTVSLARGANRGGRERGKVKASRIQSSRIGSALVCVCRNVQHRELKLPKSTRFALITAVMVAVPTGGPTGCLVSPPPLFSQTYSHTKTPSQAIGHRMYD